MCKKTKITIIFLLAVLGLLFFSQGVFAQEDLPECNIEDWNRETCYRDAIYRRNFFSAPLAECLYSIQSGPFPECPISEEEDNLIWYSACDCEGLHDITCPVTIPIGSDENCNLVGGEVCKGCIKQVAASTPPIIDYSERFFAIDFEPPFTTIQCNNADCKPDNEWYNVNVQIFLECNDCGDGDCSGCAVTYHCDDQTNTCVPEPNIYEGPFDVTNEGENYVRFFSLDRIGNVEIGSSPRFQKVNIDESLPRTTIDPDGGGFIDSVNFSLSCDDDHSGCQATYYKIIDVTANETLTCNPDDTENFVAGSFGTVDCLTDEKCKKKVCYYSVDRVGNRELTKTSNIFERLLYTLNINSTAGGSVTTPGEGAFAYNPGTEVDLVAVPDSGQVFFNWTGNGTSSIADVNASSTTIIMNNDYSITANFQEIQYDLVIGSTDGGEVSDPGEGTFPYGVGTNVPLVAMASSTSGYEFFNWTGNDTSTIADVNASSTTIIMNNDYSITANFVLQNHTLTVIINGDGEGMVVFSQSGAQCESTNTPCLENYIHGHEALLYAYAEDSSDFVEWTGPCGGGEEENVCSVIMNTDKEVTATFNLKEYNIAAGAGEGGSIVPSGNVTVKHGNPQTFIIEANANYKIEDVVVNGGSVGTTTSYTFENVTSSQTIYAAFEIADQERPTAEFITPVTPDPGSWQKENFSITLRYADTGGSGLSLCQYRVESDGVPTYPTYGNPDSWAAAGGTCSGNNPPDITESITVGSTANCRHQGIDICTVYVQAQDGVGNWSDISSRPFSIDWTDPVIRFPDPS